MVHSGRGCSDSYGRGGQWFVAVVVVVIVFVFVLKGKGREIF